MVYDSSALGWPEEDIATLHALLAVNMSTKNIALQLGRTEDSVYGYIYRNKLKATKSIRKWTENDKINLEELIAEGVSYSSIAHKLDRTVPAVRTQACISGNTLTKTNYNISAVCKLLGISHTTVDWWIEARILKASAISKSKIRKTVVIVREDLLTFLENEEYWPYWDYETITDDALREWARDERIGKRWLSTEEVGNILGYCAVSILNKIYKGLIRAKLRHGRRFYVREDWLPAEIERLKNNGPPWWSDPKIT